MNSDIQTLFKLFKKSRFLTSCIQEVLKELELKGLGHIKPCFRLGSSWHTPDGSLEVVIPAYIIDGKKRKQKALSKELVLSFLRHEMGHVIDHYYGLSKKKTWAKVFGNPKKTYNPHRYTADPESCDYVDHLDSFYAQSHPYEDFAETFAVWLNPKSQWQKVYKKKPVVIHKFTYMISALQKQNRFFSEN